MTDPDVLVAGETLVDFLPDEPGPLAEVSGFTRRAGGAPANVAVALARLGEKPYFLTRFGGDPFGAFLEATLDEHGVPCRFVSRDPDRPTTLAFVAGDDGDGPRFTFYRENAADLHVDAASVPDEALDAVSWLVVGGVLLSADPARSALHSLVARAREHDCTVVFDPNRRPELWADEASFADELDRFIRGVDVIVASNEDLEGTRFAADRPEDQTALLTDAGPHTAFVTLGSSGSFAHATDDAPWGPETVSHAGYPVDAVDTTGAGDAFLGGAMAALVGGEDRLGEVLGFANAVAALATTRTGAMAALPDRDAVYRLREEQGD